MSRPLLSRSPCGEAGGTSAMFAVLALAMLVAVALVVDGGRKLGALTGARDMADSAARVGAQEIDIDRWRVTGDPVIDPVRAEAAVQAFLRDNFDGAYRPPARVTVVGEDITVEVVVEPRRFLLDLGSAVASEHVTAEESVTGG